MEELKVLVKVEKSLAIMAGKAEYGMGLVTVNPANLTEEQRQVLIESDVRQYQGSSYLYPQNERFITIGDVPLTEACETAVIAALNSRTERREQKLQKEKTTYEMAIAEYLATAPEMLYRTKCTLLVDGEVFKSISPETHEWFIDKDKLRCQGLDKSFAEDERVQAHLATVEALCASHNAEAASKVRESLRKRAEVIVRNGPGDLLLYCRSNPVGKRWQLPDHFAGYTETTWERCKFHHVVGLITEAEAQAQSLNSRDVKAYHEQVDVWVATKGTENQKKRHALGLLPVWEVFDGLCNDAFQVLDRFPRSEPEYTALCPCKEETCCVVKSDMANWLTAEEFKVFDEISKDIKWVYPSASVVALSNELESEDCGYRSTFKSVLVTVEMGVFDLVRAYELP